MMNSSTAQSMLQKLSDYQLKMEMAHPSGLAPMDMISSEIKRRAMMRQGMPAYMPGSALPTGIQSGQPVIGAPAEGGPPPTGYARGGSVSIGSFNPNARPLTSSYPGLWSMNGGLGGVRHFDDGGATSSNPSIMGASNASQFGYMDPMRLAALRQQATAGYQSQFGLPGGQVGDMPTYMNQMKQYVRDPTQAYNPMIEEMQRQADQAQQANKGRPLMEMGLALMQGGPNFWQDLGRAGQVGLDTSDKIRANQSEMMRQLMAAKMSQANAQSQYDENIFSAANQNRNTDRQALIEAAKMGDSDAQAQLQAQDEMAGANLKMWDRNQEDATTLQHAKIMTGPEWAKVGVERARLANETGSNQDPRKVYLGFLSDAKNQVGKQVWTKDPKTGKPTLGVYSMTDAANDAQAGTQSYMQYLKTLQSQRGGANTGLPTGVQDPLGIRR